MKKYPAHPCIDCGAVTTNKNYCDRHLAMVKRPQYVFKASTSLITADCDCVKSRRRTESVNELRG